MALQSERLRADSRRIRDVKAPTGVGTEQPDFGASEGGALNASL